MAPDNYTIFDLMDDMDRAALRREAAAKIAEMPEFERYFLLGLLRHEEAKDGAAGIERVIAWVAHRGMAIVEDGFDDRHGLQDTERSVSGRSRI